ncbi:MAG: hypothetical protein ACPLZ9_06570, partial [Candidatus Ratteibacteria bacterium]
EMGIYGIINICNKGWCSFYDFGIKIVEFLKFDIKINGLSFENFSEMFGIVAKRPKFSALSIDLLSSLNIKMEPWENALERFLKEE